ncbi:LytR/AlgR family response regulator transcription factor [Terrisporobacter vanillatitrophus]|uniref:LytR/AlgR family response regulator transcription factor n=1 Tax=Terrisporobacter vanillatitrophus TaxID=3058402 RepID=UPI003368828E
MRIAIIDDLMKDRTDVKNIINEFFLERFTKLNKMDLKIDEFENGEDFLSVFKPNYYDIIILDIYMKNITGMETARKIFNADKSCNIIFLTSSSDHVLDSFEVKAVFYIIKPITLNKDKLFTALDYCLENLKLDTSSLEIIINKKPINLLFSNIMYVDCERRISKFHMTNTTLVSNKSLSNYCENLLSDKRFIECFRGIVVNMDHIDRIENDDFILTNGEILPITKRKKSTIKDIYFEYFLKKRGL